jgi:hypothetical protein
MEWFADVQCGSTLREMLQGRHSPFGRLSPVPGCDLLAGELRILVSFRTTALEEIAREWSEAVRVS